MSGAGTTVAAGEVPADVASVARIWVAAPYDDLRQAGRIGPLVRRILAATSFHVRPQTTALGDISYFMVHEWLLNVVGRRRGDLAPDTAFSELNGALRMWGDTLIEATELWERLESAGPMSSPAATRPRVSSVILADQRGERP